MRSGCPVFLGKGVFVHMVTPKAYKDSLAAGIVTTEMMRDALYSVNKRAKNYRDAERECRHLYRGKYADSNCRKKEGFYQKKEKLLSFLHPACIHREFRGYRRVRVYDYEPEYGELYGVYRLLGRIVWENCYFDYDGFRDVWFFDYVTDELDCAYYLYYVCGDRSFHTPVSEGDVAGHGLPVLDIGGLDTHGDDCHELLSMQFTDKVLAALEGGEAVYRETSAPAVPEREFVIPSFSGLYRVTAGSIYAALGMVQAEVSQVLALRVVKDEVFVGDVAVMRRSFSLKQRNGTKRKPYRKPVLKGVPEYDILHILREPEMVAYLARNLEGVSGDVDIWGMFLGLCVSESSPVYGKLMEAVRRKEVSDAASGQVRAEIAQLFAEDCTRRIVLRDGEVVFSEDGM